MSKYCSDILQKRQASIHSIILRLSCLGWTQEEIGEVVGKSQDTISLITKKFTDYNLRNFFDSGKTVEQIGEMLNSLSRIQEKLKSCLNYCKTNVRLFYTLKLSGKTL